ncbi:hypothetical protein OG21DRAFT_1104748 [Imleria badia]|nr:hypothetical protein OG21DRAFT_1104748 [Imleria badia]
MSNLIFDEQWIFNSHASADPVITEYQYPFIGPTDSVPDCLINPLQITRDIYSPSWIPDENALGLYETGVPESAWGVDLITCPSATIPSNQIDTQIFSTSFSHQLSPFESVVHSWQTPAPYYSPVPEEAAFSGRGDNPIPHSFHPIALQGGAVRKPTARSLTKRVDASRLLRQSTPPRSQRHAPYPIGPDSTRRSAPPVTVYQCQWIDSTGPCGAIVAGTKNTIGQHLQYEHAIRLKADKTFEVCCWGGCRKSMRRESIPRHVLAVHMRDKVPCPSCGSLFARTDSLKRHQRTPCLPVTKGENAGQAGECHSPCHNVHIS